MKGLIKVSFQSLNLHFFIIHRLDLETLILGSMIFMLPQNLFFHLFRKSVKFLKKLSKSYHIDSIYGKIDTNVLKYHKFSIVRFGGKY